MGCCFDGESLGPTQQFMRGNLPFLFLLEFLREISHTLGQLVGMRQKKSEVESTGRIQDLARLFQIRSFAGISSPASPIREVKEQLGGTTGLSHWPALPAHIRFRTVSTRLRTPLARL